MTDSVIPFPDGSQIRFIRGGIDFIDAQGITTRISQDGVFIPAGKTLSTASGGVPVALTSDELAFISGASATNDTPSRFAVIDADGFITLPEAMGVRSAASASGVHGGDINFRTQGSAGGNARGGDMTFELANGKGTQRGGSFTFNSGASDVADGDGGDHTVNAGNGYVNGGSILHALGGGETGVNGIYRLTMGRSYAYWGRQGETDPALKVDASTADCVTGLTVKSKATGDGVELLATDSGATADIVLTPKGTAGRVTTTKPMTITSASATAFVVGPNGTTNPAFIVNCTPVGVAVDSGVEIIGGEVGEGTNPTIAAISSRTDENLTLTGKGAGVVTFSGSGVDIGPAGLKDASNIVLGTTTGTKIGTATTQKLGFYNATPIAQRAGAAQAAIATTGATNVTPYGFTTAAQADAIVTLANELRAWAVAQGFIKGAA